MTETTTSGPGFLALRMQGHISLADIERSYALLDDAFETSSKVDLFIEATGITGFDTEALGVAAKRGWALLGRLDRFGRVAIVSDDSWIRWASRIESALLPNITYRIYTRAERALALDWVQRREDLPYGQAVTILETSRPDVLGIEIDGRLSAEELGHIARSLTELRRARPLKAILVRFRSLEGVDPGIVADGEYLRMKLGLLRQLDRYAIVGGPDWLVRAAELMRPLLRLDLRHFAADDEAAAWAWLGAQPLAASPMAA